MRENPYKSPATEADNDGQLPQVHGLPSALRSAVIFVLFGWAAGAFVGLIAWLSHVTSNPLLRDAAFQQGWWIEMFISRGRPTFFLGGLLSFIALIAMRISRY